MYRHNPPSYLRLLAASLAAGLAALPAGAHIAGRLGVDHYVCVAPALDVLRVDYHVHLGEMPTAAVTARLDTSKDGTVSDAEWSVYLDRALPVYAGRLSATLQQTPDAPPVAVPLGPDPEGPPYRVRLVDGPEGMPTCRIHWRLAAAWPGAAPLRGAP